MMDNNMFILSGHEDKTKKITSYIASKDVKFLQLMLTFWLRNGGCGYIFKGVPHEK